MKCSANDAWAELSLVIVSVILFKKKQLFRIAQAFL